jgi:hypothetical protein
MMVNLGLGFTIVQGVGNQTVGTENTEWVRVVYCVKMEPFLLVWRRQVCQ